MFKKLYLILLFFPVFSGVSASEGYLDEIGIEIIDEQNFDGDEYGIGADELMDLQEWECSSAYKYRKFNDFTCGENPFKDK